MDVTSHTHERCSLGCERMDAEEAEWWDVRYVWNQAERPPTPSRYRERRRLYLRGFNAPWADGMLLLDEAKWLTEDARWATTRPSPDGGREGAPWALIS